MLFTDNADLLKRHFAAYGEALDYHRSRGDKICPAKIAQDYILRQQQVEQVEQEHDAWLAEINRANKRLLQEIRQEKGRTFHKYLLQLLSDVDYSNELFEIVDSPTGEYQAEKYGYTIKGYWVHQWAVGKNWEGYIYVELKKGKFFKVKFCM